MSRVKAVCVPQPWASAAVFGGLEVLSLPFPTQHRGPILIFSGPADSRAMANRQVHTNLSGQHYRHRCNELLGVVDVLDCTNVNGRGLPWAFGPWCWIIGHPTVFLNPVPWIGFEDITEINDDAVDRAVLEAISPREWMDRQWAKRQGRLFPDDAPDRPRADGWMGD